MSILRYLFRSAASNPVEARFNVITKYHNYIFIVMFLSKIPVIWHVLNLMILNPRMSYTCGGSDKAEDNNDVVRTLRLVSAETCPCDNPTWDTSVFTETIQTRFGLICDKKYLISLSETCTYFGMLVGSFSFGILADRFGRVSMFCTTFFLTALFGLAISQSPNVQAFFVFRFLEGLGAGGSIVTGFVAIIEYTGTKFRETMTALYHFPINCGHLLLPAVSYAVKNAFHFQMAISIPMFFFAFVFYFINESPLWLLNNNYKERAIKSLEAIAKFNNQKDTTIRSDIEAYYSSKGPQQKKIQLYHIFKYRRLTTNLLCMAYIYLVCGMGYYGVSQYISHMSGDIHINIAVSAVLAMPGTFISIILLNKIGRKPFLLSTGVGSGLFMIITVIIPDNFNPAWLKVFFACISNCFFFMSFIVVFLYGVELFPTQIRNSALGFLSLLSRAGMMIAPQINTLSSTIAGYVFGVLALVGGCLTICLPETKNKELPCTLEEAESRD